MRIIRSRDEWNRFVAEESFYDDARILSTPESFPCLVELAGRFGNERLVSFMYYPAAKALVSVTEANSTP
jgi:hypothetical protein